MKPEFKEVIKLHREGLSPEEIKDEVSVSRATIYRYIEQFEASADLLSEEDQSDPLGAPTAPTEDLQEEFDDSFDEESEEEGEYDEEEESDYLNGIHRSNELREKEIEIREKEALIKSQKDKKTIMRSFNKLVAGIQEHVQGSKWTQADFKKLQEEITTLKDETEHVLEYDPEAIEENSYHTILSIIENEIQSFVGQDPDYEITISWVEEKQNLLIEALDLNDFDDETFDSHEYHKQLLFGVYSRHIDEFLELEDEKMETEDTEKLISETSHIINTINETGEIDIDEFEDELNVLQNLESFLKELLVRIDESFWGTKRLTVPSEFKNMYQTTFTTGDEEMEDAEELTV